MYSIFKPSYSLMIFVHAVTHLGICIGLPSGLWHNPG